MAEKKENKTESKTKNLNSYFTILKKYILKLLQLDPETYFFIVPGILLLIGLLPVPDLYFAILRIYLFVSALVLTYKFYSIEKDNIFAAIFACIAVIYNPILFIKFGNNDIKTGPIIFVLTLSLFILGYKKIKDK